MEQRFTFIKTNEKTSDDDFVQEERVELDLEASYLKGNQSIDEYLRQTAITNPHVTIIYTNPKANFGYFNSKCGDPYTYYNFWYRKFPEQTSYLNCYFLPQVDPFLKNKFAYIGKPAECNTSIRNFGSNVSDNGFKYFVTRPNTNS